jgi:uncharacterized protein YcaQ
MSQIKRLRAHAISNSLFRPGTLKAAINRLGFVQADPIRSPARSQDLILRHRVKNYRAGALERRYATLNIEEDILYAYGFLPHQTWQLLHPRPYTDRLPPFEQKVLAVVRDSGSMHPSELEKHFGSKRVVNDWGGYSKATKRALESLHHRGLLRISGRKKGIRMYEAMIESTQPLSKNERFQKLIHVVASILAPVNEKALLKIAAYFRYLIPSIADRRKVLNELIEVGEFKRLTVDGNSYVWPASKKRHVEPPRRVHFLAPFDPLVRDRERFEHLWGWTYRFEAYTPPAKRLRGPYAMPLLWIDDVIGWANANIVEGKLSVETGYVKRRPRDPDFRSELEAEVTRLATFLNLKDSSWKLRE